MKAIFVEIPAFERYRKDYLDDEAFRKLQAAMMLNLETGDVIEGTGGLRKMRFADPRRGKGKRGGFYGSFITGGQVVCSSGSLPSMTRMKWPI